MNVTNKDISQTNILPKLSDTSDNTLDELLASWASQADPGDQITVTI